MSAYHVQASVSQHLAASTPSRRRSVPPSLPEPVSRSPNQRWRERPRCCALRAARPLETGSFTPSLAVPLVSAVEHHLSGKNAPPACPFPHRVLGANTRHKHAKMAATLQVPIDARNRIWNMTGMALGHSTAAIAIRSLAPCSALSMLCAPLRPRRVRRGLRALTALARGTSWAIARWRVSMASDRQRQEP